MSKNIVKKMENSSFSFVGLSSNGFSYTYVLCHICTIAGLYRIDLGLQGYIALSLGRFGLVKLWVKISWKFLFFLCRMKYQSIFIYLFFCIACLYRIKLELQEYITLSLGRLGIVKLWVKISWKKAKIFLRIRIKYIRSPQLTTLRGFV
jgi:hypothetical protein